MRRRLLNLLTGLSLLLCVTAVALWVRTYIRSDTIGRASLAEADPFTHLEMWTADTARGSFAVRRDRNSMRHTPPSHWGHADWEWESHAATDRVYLRPAGADVWTPLLRRSGFELYRAHYRGADGGSAAHWRVTWPAWATVLLAGALPASRLWRRIRRGPLAPGLCARCGYDLRATPGRCPECGKEAAPM